MIVGLVGPDAAGKSTLSKTLRALGYQVKHIAQEHSFVQEMWQIIARPDVLVYLDVSYETSLKRRPQTLTIKDYQVEIDRLLHARRNADLIIQTDDLTPEEVAQKVIDFLELTGKSR